MALVPDRPDAKRAAHEQFSLQVRGMETRGVVVELQRFRAVADGNEEKFLIDGGDVIRIGLVERSQGFITGIVRLQLLGGL